MWLKIFIIKYIIFSDIWEENLYGLLNKYKYGYLPCQIYLQMFCNLSWALQQDCREKNKYLKLLGGKTL